MVLDLYCSKSSYIEGLGNWATEFTRLFHSLRIYGLDTSVYPS
jgi:hypothetical protein